ncbi:MAG: HK97 family phage prohead protease [Pseudobutyrivibrio sp.]|nr:HK97 family phage prohead protease [Pseudobutyrivibrio sp.]
MTMSVTGYDFCGWATKNDLRCADGRVIRHGAFTANDGKRVPLVWNHQHNSPSCVLGHAILENRDDGVFAYGFFNDTQQGQDAKNYVKHGDVEALSIWANNLQQAGSDVLHGVIREVSLVLSGANPGAFIESVVHSNEPIDEYEDEGIIYTNESLIIEHSEPITTEEVVEEETSEEIMHSDEKKEEPKEETKVAESTKEQSVQDVIDTMNEEQQTAMYALIGAAVEQAKAGKLETNNDDDDDDEEEEEMKHNIFENEYAEQGNFLSHSDMSAIFSDAKRCGSLREAFENYTDGGELAHSIDTTGMDVATGTQTYGFNDPDMLFPEYKAFKTQPEWISRRMDWVSVVMNGVHRSPFSRVKSVYANITEDEARAKGYIKGNQKVSEVFSTLKRTTDPQTIYKLQKMDRDDIIDITDFDVVAWIKAEMRVMLDEEIARAILIGDGRLPDSDDKIQENHVRAICNDVPLFNIRYGVEVDHGASEAAVANQFIDDCLLAREQYRGSGNPVMFTTERMLNRMLLLKDDIGHRLYKTVEELTTALRVTRIVTVEPMTGHQITVSEEAKDLLAIIVNLNDYNVGADRGGAVSLFDDFDIDYNKYTYLIETRLSGALIKPFSAITMYKDEAAE